MIPIYLPRILAAFVIGVLIALFVMAWVLLLLGGYIIGVLLLVDWLIGLERQLVGVFVDPAAIITSALLILLGAGWFVAIVQVGVWGIGAYRKLRARPKQADGR